MYIVDPEIVRRNLDLQRLGYGEYADYLKSVVWRRIKERVYHQKGRKCSLCPEPASCIHHNLYGVKTLTGRNFKPLHPICDACHEKLHFKNGQYMPLSWSRDQFWRLKKKLVKKRRIRYR